MVAYRMKAVLLAAGVSMIALPLVTMQAAAQSRDAYDDRGYDDPPPPPRDRGGYDDRAYDDQAYDDRDGADSRYYDESYDRAPPPGYDGTRPPPPPRGWSADGDQGAYQAEDDRFAYGAEQWAQNNCVKSQNNAGVGAVVGGLIGALVGNAASGRRDRTGGTLAGAAVGAAGGAIVGGASSNQTSPGCPPGYVVRGGAANFAYGGQGFVYAAPAWYRPWVFNGGRWLYRPYPYHRFYARHYWRPRAYRRGFYGRPRYRRRW
jgi:hypothetical protein